eukprot:CAMPEP_0114657220 /NCGR_PEP_ID=MMETSP0191-20121206/13526_1 /TAXON_ID=126664 /ORGANISM="Sorites sp." /LENGTH=76 /DNA_ID=CAMNT_0001876017 /DNA_START=1070 /DNA_END=1300 /DNA_ORIENTATION=-
MDLVHHNQQFLVDIHQLTYMDDMYDLQNLYVYMVNQMLLNYILHHILQLVILLVMVLVLLGILLVLMLVILLDQDQ